MCKSTVGVPLWAVVAAGSSAASLLVIKVTVNGDEQSEKYIGLISLMRTWVKQMIDLWNDYIPQTLPVPVAEASAAPSFCPQNLSTKTFPPQVADPPIIST